MKTLIEWLAKVLKWEPVPSFDNDPIVPVVVATDPLEAPKPPATAPITPKPIHSMLDTFCTAVRDYEGAPGNLNYVNNNPGNVRCSSVGYLAKYGNVRCVGNFAVFETYALGWEYLESLVHYRAVAHPNWTIVDFFSQYAPTSDNNNPHAYTNFVATRCGVPVTTTLATLFG